MHKDLRIVYKGDRPYSIRDETGHLFFFAHITKYSGQETRYLEERLAQTTLANYLFEALRERE